MQKRRQSFLVELTLVGLSIWLAWNLCSTEIAEAYLTREKFESAIEQGGGGGRFFTASPLDQQSCAVCHMGGNISPQLQLLDELPESYRIGDPIRITIVWAETSSPSAGSLEVVDQYGKGMGELKPIDIPGSQCSDGENAIEISTDTENERNIAGTQVCGAHRLGVEWTPNEEATGPAYIYATAVVAGTESGQGQPSGDQADIWRGIIPTESGQANLVTIGSCSLSSLHGSHYIELWLSTFLGIIFLHTWIKSVCKNRPTCSRINDLR